MTSANQRIRELQRETNKLREQTDPVRNHKFTFWIFGENVPTLRVPIMYVSGLVASREARETSALHVAKIGRAVVPGDLTLAHWFNEGTPREVMIDVPGMEHIFLSGCDPVSFGFSDLDKGENKLLIEFMTIEYSNMSYWGLSSLIWTPPGPAHITDTETVVKLPVPEA